MELATKKIKNRYTFSAEGLDEIRQFHARVMATCGCLQRVRDARGEMRAASWREGDEARRRACPPPTAIRRLREGRRYRDSATSRVMRDSSASTGTSPRSLPIWKSPANAREPPARARAKRPSGRARA